MLDDEDSNIITAGSIVTVNVHLKRRSMSDLFNQDCPPQFISIANAANAALVDDVDDLTAAGFSGEDLIEIPHSDSFTAKVFSLSFWLFMHKDPADSGFRWCPILQKGEDDESDLIYERAPAIYYDREDKFLKVYVSTDEMVNYPQGEPKVAA